MLSPQSSLPRCLVFDLDSTLAKSKQPIESPMAQALAALLARTMVAVTSGGKLAQLVTQVAERLPPEAPLEHLYLLPTSGAALYTYQNGGWASIYEEALTPEEAHMIREAIHQANDATHTVDFSTPSHGERIEFRGSQVSISALGQEAPLAEKENWDPARTKRETLREALAPFLPNYEVRIGGTTTIDITKKGVDKAYGLRQLSAHLDIPITDMCYIGDQLYPDGNDAAVIPTGVPTHPVKNPSDTLAYIESLLA